MQEAYSVQIRACTHSCAAHNKPGRHPRLRRVTSGTTYGTPPKRALTGHMHAEAVSVEDRQTRQGTVSGAGSACRGSGSRISTLKCATALQQHAIARVAPWPGWWTLGRGRSSKASPENGRPPRWSVLLRFGALPDALEGFEGVRSVRPIPRAALVPCPVHRRNAVIRSTAGPGSRSRCSEGRPSM